MSTDKNLSQFYGRHPQDPGGPVGVFAGKSMNTYLFENIIRNPHISETSGGYQFSISNGADFLASRTSYKLNLTGPSMGIQTACSTSLTAVHVACKSLSAGECRMALAGGVSVSSRQKRGYLYRKDMIFSPDGHCRAFDRDAQGVVGGNGVGVVVLKRLGDAIDDRDSICAVIKGSAVNNDGVSKVGFTAPGVDGQAAVITEAQAAAGVDADAIQYIEAHGTGTKLGDPVEIATLTQAFRKTSKRKNFCAVGSLKTNMGRLNAAAGVASLIKTVLAIQNRKLPPSLHFKTPNPKIDFANSPFYVNDRLREWEAEDGAPLRAGVSSFGIGGSNAHVILEEAPRAASAHGQRERHILILSARTETALNRAALNLADHLKQHRDVDLSDVSHTLCVGRNAFQHRAFLTCRDADEAVEKIASGRGLFTGRCESRTGRSRNKPSVDPDTESGLIAAGRLWLEGERIDWPSLYKGEKRRRIPLPTYPFERRRYRVEPATLPNARGKAPSLDKKNDITDWFYIPSWKRLPPPEDEIKSPSGPVLLFIDNTGAGGHLVHRLTRRGADVVIVKPGEKFGKHERDVYRIDPGGPDDYSALFTDLGRTGRLPEAIVHMWSLTRERRTELEELDAALNMGCYSLLFIARALGGLGFIDPLRIVAVTNGVHQVTGEEVLHPEKAAVLGPVKIIPLEYPNITCRAIDVVHPATGAPPEKELWDRIGRELTAENGDPVVALRGTHRWIQTFDRVRLEASDKWKEHVREKGVYLITGGLGGIGLTIAEHLAKTLKARLVLTGRSMFPERDKWAGWLKEHGEQNRVGRKIKILEEMERSGAEVLTIRADAADPGRMGDAADLALRSFGQINGVIHSAGIADQAGVIQKRTKEMTREVLEPKIKGAMVLDGIVEKVKPDFLLLCSSLATVFYKSQFGQAAYVAANEFLDAFAYSRSSKNGLSVTSVNWDAWREVGMAVDAVARRGLRSETLQQGISPFEGTEVVNRILGKTWPRVVVSTLEPMTPREQEALVEHPGLPSKKETMHSRPELDVEYVSPRNEIERVMAHIWQESLGVEKIGINDDFFQLGGDSLLGTRVLSRIHEQLDASLPVAILFEEPTIAILSRRIETIRRQTEQVETLSETVVQAGRKRVSL